METDGITTPFGRRAMTLGMLAGQVVARTVSPEASVDKWKLYRWLCEARPRLAISDRALSVLNALLSFYPKTELAGNESLVVFPSNAQLALRTHGMAETTLRRHLAALVEAGLLTRRDSPNGKRYVRRDREGTIGDAFGFSLAPLLARAGEIETLAADVTAERLLLQRLRERVTLLRRDIVKLIETGLEEGFGGDWMGFEAEYRREILGLPRVATPVILSPIIAALETLHAKIVNCLEKQFILRNTAGNGDHTERHKQNSKPDSTFDFEPRFRMKQDGDGDFPPEPPSVEETGITSGKEPTEKAAGVTPSATSRQRDARPGAGSEPHKPYPLPLVLQACPEIIPFGPGGTVSSWRDLMAAAVVVRSMLAVSPSAYENACAVMGPENAATVIACILERSAHINSAGGYLRDLSNKAERGEFSIGPMLMALARANGTPAKRAG